ncbi:TPA: non-canonical purine NTP pyrophosphatase, RdgB/HAM1 family [bacterium]|nr:non-canonical purine NTP pyrophosphatase, RdgB/HAM1 family [bacterium]
MKQIFLGTTNPNKVSEIKEILDIPIDFILPSDIGIITKPKEHGKTIYENAVQKALEYAKLSSLLTMAEDSGIEIDALDGRPGVLSSRFGGDIPYKEKNELILSLMKDVPYEKRKTRYRAVIAIASPDGLIKTEEGIVEGMIAFEQRGNNGFGYDPIFFYPPYNKTFGEVEREDKNKVSHRAEALRKIKPLLEKLLKCQK